MPYKIVTWRLGCRHEFEIDAKTDDEALREFDRWMDSDEHFVELLIRPDGSVLWDNKKEVLGYLDEEESGGDIR